MSILRLLKRSTETALKLPLAAAWDAVSLCNVGSDRGSSTLKVLREHERQKARDEAADDRESR